MGEDYDIQRENRHGLAVANAVIRARDERDETRVELAAANATIARLRRGWENAQGAIAERDATIARVHALLHGPAKSGNSPEIMLGAARAAVSVIKEGGACDVVVDPATLTTDDCLARVRALPDKWLRMTQDGQGKVREHWRGQDFVDGQDAATESCADDIRAALAGAGGAHDG